MDALMVALRFAIALLFLVGGIGKLADLASTRRAIAEFGVPELFAGPLGVLLPVVELSTAAGLVIQQASWWAAASAATLLTGFLAAIAANLYHGRSPNSPGFGRLRPTPVGLGMLVLNLLLLLGALLLVAQSGADPGLDLSSFGINLTPGQLFLGFALALLAAVAGWSVRFLLLLFQQHDSLLRRVEELEGQVGVKPAATPATGSAPRSVSTPMPRVVAPGMLVPEHAFLNVDGHVTRLSDFRGRRVAMLFWDPACSACVRMREELVTWEASGQSLDLLVIARGTADENRHAGMRAPVVLDQESALGRLLGVSATPAAVVIDEDGCLASRAAAIGAEQVMALLRRGEGGQARPVMAAGAAG